MSGMPGRLLVLDAQTMDMTNAVAVDIALKSNQSTGFQWVLVDSAALSPLRFVRKRYVIPRENRDSNGAGGTETWTFSTPEPGQATINLVYKRPWETTRRRRRRRSALEFDEPVSATVPDFRLICYRWVPVTPRNWRRRRGNPCTGVIDAEGGT